jgi:hypothetical protein
VEQIGRFWIDPAQGPCGEVEATLRGEGLPAGVLLRLAFGDPGPFAHNFGEIGRAVVADDGTFASAVTLPVSCEASAIAIYGSIYEGLDAARWKAIYTVAQP